MVVTATVTVAMVTVVIVPVVVSMVTVAMIMVVMVTVDMVTCHCHAPRHVTATGSVMSVTQPHPVIVTLGLSLPSAPNLPLPYDNALAVVLEGPVWSALEPTMTTSPDAPVALVHQISCTPR